MGLISQDRAQSKKHKALMKVELDTKAFDAAFKRYVKASKRSLAEICNKKAAMIATKAAKYTKRGDKGHIESSLGGYVTVTYTPSKGKYAGQTRSKRVLQLTKTTVGSRPAYLAQVLVNVRRRNKGLKGYGGNDLSVAARKMVRARLKAITYLASGWIDAIKALLPILENKAGVWVDRSIWTNRGKVAKGGARIAKDVNWTPFAEIKNTVSPQGKEGAHAREYIADGLQRGVDEETASMNAYADARLQKDADSFNRQ